MAKVKPLRHIVWSTDTTLELSALFQGRWYIRQVPLHGRAEDIRTLDLEEVASLLDELHLPPEVYHLWKAFFEEQDRVKDKGVLLPLQEKALRLLDQLPAKGADFDLHGFAVAPQQARTFPDEPERWPVKMCAPFTPRDLGQTFQHLALEILRNGRQTPCLI